MGISDVGAGQVCYTSHLTTQKEKHRVECDYCGTYFGSVRTMKRHQRTHTRSGAQYLRYTYSKSFGEHKKLKHHHRKRTRERKHKCEFCPKIFNQSQHLKTHRRIHTGERPYQCELCSKKFNRPDILKVHLRVHSGEKPFQCEVCHKTFKQSEHLKLHQRFHTGEKPFQCEFCPKRFSQSGHLKSHHRVHTGEKPFQCEFCPKRFNQRSNLKSHCKLHTGEKSQYVERIENGDTGKPEDTVLEVLDTDATTEVATDEDEMVAPRTVTEIAKWIKPPELKETPAAGYHCEYCSEVCKSASGLLQHQNSHFVHKCEFCDRVFQDYSTLQDHFSECHPLQGKLSKASELEETIKSSSTGYQCESCSKVCKSASGLRNHQKSHLAHECQFCGKVFRYANTLQDHYSEHHPEQEKLTHRCTDCLKCFPTAITQVHVHIKNDCQYCL